MSFFKFKESMLLIKFFKEDKLIFIFYLFLSFLCSGLIILGSYFVGQTINLISENMSTNDVIKIVYASLITISLYIFYWILNSMIVCWTIKLSYRSGSRIRYAIFTKYLNVSISYIDKNKIGELMSRATNDIDMMISSVVQVMAGMFTSPLIIISIFITNLFFSPLLSLISFLLALLTLIFIWFIAKKSSPDFEKMQEKIGSLNSLSKEYITNKQVIYLFGMQEKAKMKFKNSNNKFRISSYKAEYKVGMLYPALDIIENIIYGLLLLVGIIFITKKIPNGGIQNLSFGLLTTFVLLNRIALGEIGSISRFASIYEKMFACAKRINEIIIQDEDFDIGTDKIDNLQGSIEFKNVSFGYSEDKMILKNFNLKIEKGQKIGIVGPTGSGKSTIINLLMRFYDVDSGQILLDGKDISTIKKSELRKHISIVLQETHLFSESIYTNISYGHYKEEIDKDAIKKAASKIGSDHFINVLPNNYETQINDSISISQGESQMLALTRAYYSPASILILDEATSSVDSLTEQKIQKGMEVLMKDKTSIIVAHRLSTIKDANQILVLKDGKIIEKGSHNELIKLKGYYEKMYRANQNEFQDY